MSPVERCAAKSKNGRTSRCVYGEGHVGRHRYEIPTTPHRKSKTPAPQHATPDCPVHAKPPPDDSDRPPREIWNAECFCRKPAMWGSRADPKCFQCQGHGYVKVFGLIAAIKRVTP